MHAKGKTALDVASEIARAASARLPERVEDLAPAVRNALIEFGGKHFNIVIDALDEAIDAVQARLIIQGIVLPLVETCADVGAQAVVGSRRRDDRGDLLRAFGDGLTLIDLDTPQYFELEDLEGYALATLQLRGAERTSNPYADDSVAGPVAARIAFLSDRNFLVAGLTALSHGLTDNTPVIPEELVFSSKVEDALNSYLSRVEAVAGASAATILTVLAFGQSPGLSVDLWAEGLKALTGIHLSENQLLEFARSSAANFLLEHVNDPSSQAFRLFHQALNDTLLRDRSDKIAHHRDEKSLTLAFFSYGKRLGWTRAPGYLLRSLARHASAGKCLDEILNDDDYLLYADLGRLIPLVDEATSSLGQERARLLRLTPYAISAAPENRIALFSVTEALENLTPKYRTSHNPAPYRARWAATTARAERAVLEGHTAAVSAICSFTINGRSRIAAAGTDSTILVWDPATAMQLWRLEGHREAVRAICALTIDDRTTLASGGDDCTIRIWNLAVAGETRVIEDPSGAAHSLTAFRDAHGRTILASTGAQGTVCLWDPIAGRELCRLEGHSGSVAAVCTFADGEETLLATGGEDATIRIWNPATGSQERVLEGHIGLVWALCPFLSPDGRTMLASTGSDGTVRLWDPIRGVQSHSINGHAGWIWDICAFPLAGRQLLALACADASVRIWDPETGRQRQVLDGHADDVLRLCSFYSGERTLLASAGADNTVRVWDPQANQQQAGVAHTGMVRSVCVVRTPSGLRIASGGDDGSLQAWDLLTGRQQWSHPSHDGPVYGMCAIPDKRRTLLATVGADDVIRIWNPTTGEREREIPLHAQNTWIWSLSYLKVARSKILIAAGDDNAVHLYDLEPLRGDRYQLERMPYSLHAGAAVKAVCVLPYINGFLLAAGAEDGIVRVWTCHFNAATHGPVDPSAGKRRRRLEYLDFGELMASIEADYPIPLQGHQGQVLGISAIKTRTHTLLATAGVDRTIRIWNPVTGRQERLLEGHAGPVRAVCTFETDNRSLLVSVGDDWTARIWDPLSGDTLQVIRLHYPALAVTQAEDSIIVGLSSGLLTLQPDVGRLSVPSDIQQ
ncbi:MAG TPA: WD40 repeat domain-containing protein [Streptosporangiaceae bacterium]|nr:WD40 repeat domain-containing protein [Streptosporangiaceae bacterium]